MFAPKTLILLIIFGLLLAVLLGAGFVSGVVPLWIVVALVGWLLWLAFGQVRRMRVVLEGSLKPLTPTRLPETTFPTETSVGEGLKKTGVGLKNGLKQFLVFVSVLGLAFLGQAGWLMQKYEIPFDLAWKRPLQQIGLLAIPLPEMVTVPSGTFQMGERKALVPPREVNIGYAFDMGKYEITFEEFDQFVLAMREAEIPFQNGPEAGVITPYPFPEDEGWGRGRLPVINVSWYQAWEYVNWVSHQKSQQGVMVHCRLPSEAEWEYAARAGTDDKYFWGDEIGVNNANCRGCGSEWDGKQTAPVGSFSANKFKLNDMHGNVYEWVQDWHGNYSEAPADGSASEDIEGRFRVLRGGSWHVTPLNLRSAGRNRLNPDGRSNNIGFRLVCPH